MKDKKYLKIIGNQSVNGVIKVSGSKNASMPLIAAALLVKGKTVLKNVPRINDIFKMLEILKYLNVSYQFNENTLIIDSTNMMNKDLTIPQVNKIRGSYYLIGPLLEEESILKFLNVGGCNFSERPIDLHLDLLKSIGAKIYKDEDLYIFVINKFNALNYTFKRKSVGATINAILIGIKSGREVTIKNYSSEPEVMCLIDFLIKAGLNIKIDDESICFQRKSDLNSIEYYVIPDRIEAETYALIGLGLGKIGIFDFKKEHHSAFLSFLDKNNVVYELNEDFLMIDKYKIDASNYIYLSEYPNLSTDIGPILLSYLLLGEKMFIIEDTIYPNRLNKLLLYKSTFCFFKNKLLVNPLKIEKNNNIFYGTNLRDSMAYLYYCLTHDGEFELYGLDHLFRGYEDVINKLISLGCKVELIDEE